MIVTPARNRLSHVAADYAAQAIEQGNVSIDGNPTIYNGIQMRSRLEARVAAWLDSLGVAWEYEPFAFASSSGQYLPDFRIIPEQMPWQPEPWPIFLEVKGEFDSVSFFETRERMQTILASKPNALLLMADADSLEHGMAEVYHPSLRFWHNAHIVAALIEYRALSLPETWRLPAWNARPGKEPDA